MRYWITHGTSAVLRSPVIMVSVSVRSEEHTSELQSQSNLVCRLLLEKKKNGADDHPSPPHGRLRPGHGRSDDVLRQPSRVHGLSSSLRDARGRHRSGTWVTLALPNRP